MTKRSLLLACAPTLLCLTGCASGAGGSPAPAPDVVRGVAGIERVVQQGPEATSPVQAPVPEVFAALGTVYEELELNITGRVPREGRITAERRRLTRLAGRRASDYVDCGSTFSGPVADNAEVLLVVTSRVVSGGGGSMLATRVDAEARPRGTMEGVRECSSTGRLEALILEHVNARLAGTVPG